MKDASVHEELQATLEELLGEYDRQVTQVREVHARLRELSETASTPDDMVTVTVGLQGRIDDLRLHPRVYSRLCPSELSATILDLIGQATAAVTARTQELMAPLVPEGVSVDEIFGGPDHPAPFLPVEPSARRPQR